MIKSTRNEEIFRLHKLGYSYKRIGDRYNLSKSAIHKIIKAIREKKEAKTEIFIQAKQQKSKTKKVWFQRLMNGWEIGFFNWRLEYNKSELKQSLKK